ncbi:NUDIX domain-containing protein [Pedobacter hartonius]|uniref:Predicted NTP pyrophosphohydrolase, NUDIX family n=1 Tax=Pedobacter hartonius TaxID=425514 RepID=A0A1H4H8H9_9SPHI|nr:NUDIX domain-containing protein [Pedobacter hartonius]SEB18147.1 Predicted NTP pyrophosphohydrolase, NUDIX family [Pedobacter hartonius]
MKQSAGILLFRKPGNETEFFLVHPGGPFFTKKNEGWWTVPKGELLDDEEPLTAAVREFEEETGYRPSGDFILLEPIRQKGGKAVLCWAAEGDLEPASIQSNTFEIEWPPRSGKRKSFPEIDQGNWFNYADACIMINEKQKAFLEELLLRLR